MKSAIDKFSPTEVYIIADGPQASLRRRIVDKDYKSNRKREWKRGIVKAYDFLSEQEHSESFSKQLTRLQEYLNILSIKKIQIPYIEADDIIAQIANTSDKDVEVIIYSTDADFKQLISDRVFCYNPIAKLLTTKEKFLEKHGYLPNNYIYFKCIAGDKSDEITGVGERIGEKTFAKMFPIAQEEKFKSLKDLLVFSQLEVDSKRNKSKSILRQHQALIENETLLQKNWTLMQLQDVDVSMQTKDVIRKVMATSPNEFNRQRLRRMFMEDSFGSELQYFDAWSRIFTRLALKGRKV